MNQDNSNDSTPGSNDANSASARPDVQPSDVTSETAAGPIINTTVAPVGPSTEAAPAPSAATEASPVADPAAAPAAPETATLTLVGLHKGKVVTPIGTSVRVALSTSTYGISVNSVSMRDPDGKAIGGDRKVSGDMTITFVAKAAGG